MKEKIFLLGILSFVPFLLLVSCAESNMRLFAQKQESEQQAKNVTQEKTPDKKAVISGIVFYPNSTKTVDDALIFFNREDLDNDNPPSRRTITGGSGSDGNYRSEVPVGVYTICAWKQSENYLLSNVLPFGLPTGGKCETVNVSAGEKKEVNLMLAKQSGSLEGKITNWENLFLPADTQVVLYRPLKFVKGKWVLTSSEEATWDAKAEVKPDENGNFVINGLPEGTYFLRIETPGLEAKYYKTKNTKGEASPIEIKNGVKNKISFKLP
jgi:hypothetical protein